MAAFASFVSTSGASSDTTLPRVCIVTSELVGFFKNGGLGTATTGLAELLAAHEFQVTVIYTGETSQDTDTWVQKYARAGISVELLERSGKSPLIGPHSYLKWTNPWNLYQVLKSRHYDVIHFNDTLGEGCYCFLAKRFTLAFQSTLLVLAVHSPVEWILESNGQPITKLKTSLWISGERLSLTAADLVWGPSNYLLNWLIQRNYNLSSQVFQQQYVLPTERLFEGGRQKFIENDRRKDPPEEARIQEIVFFGRLEERKGIRLFVAAISKLQELIVEHRVSVLFLGKRCGIDDQPIHEYLEKSGVGWGFNWRIEDSFGQQEAIAYLRQPGKLAVIASPVDNSPCTVYEALIYRIPFIASRAGGIPEILRADFHGSHLFDYNISSLASVLSGCIVSGIGAAEPAVEQAENTNRWLMFHANWKSYLPVESGLTANQGSWVVYVEYSGSAASLERTLNSVFSQDPEKPPKYVINLKNYTAPELNPLYDIVSLRSFEESGVREALISAAQSGFTHFLSLRDGICLLPGTLLKMGSALESLADAIVPALEITSSQAVFPPFAGCPALAYLESDFDSGAICLKLQNRAFQDILSSLDEARMHLGLLEELYASGGQIWPCPDVLLTTDSVNSIFIQDTKPVRRLAAFSKATRQDVYEMMSVAHGFCSDLRALQPPKQAESRGGKFVKNTVAYLHTNPLPVKAILGNSVARKVVRLLYRLSKL